MALNIGYAFDATQVDFESGKPGRWPIGDHVVKMVGGESKQTNGKQAGYLEVHLEIVQGPHKGKICSMRLSLWPEDPQSENGQTAIRIANQTIARFCHATNVYALPDGNLEHLFNIPFGVRATPQEGKFDEKGEPYTEVKNWNIFDATMSPLRKGVPACTVPPAEQPVAYSGAPAVQQVQQQQTQQWQQQAPNANVAANAATSPASMVNAATAGQNQNGQQWQNGAQNTGGNTTAAWQPQAAAGGAPAWAKK
jgi:hypothetical protein